VCVNPNDPRYAYLKGKKVTVPLINRIVPIIQDEYVDIEFGTGVLKVTPAHDINDYMLGQKYKLESIDIFNDNGTLNERAQLYVGKDRFAVRDEIVKDLEKAGLIEKIEGYVNKVGFSERTDVAIEPKLSTQWFLKMEELAKPALEAVESDNIQLYPPKFKNTYRHWMENIKDWCISRQLWWGHRIPAYYLSNGTFVVAETEEEALALAKKETGNSNLTIADLHQDSDVLDTWFSSWLWPISVFDGIRNPENPDIKYYYPTNDLVTAPEILFFWVARMVVAGYEYRGEKPFTNVYLTGIVRDQQRRKMSKQLGNSPNPLDLIAKYGADGVRVGMLLCSPAGNDLLFDENLTEQGRNFSNKIWNAFRLVNGWQVDSTIPQPDNARLTVEWFDAMLDKTIEQVNQQFDAYNVSEALMVIYKLFWDEFSSWYLEAVKPGFNQPIDSATFNATIGYFEKLLKLLHPYMPFITEEIYHLIAERETGDCIMVSLLPQSKPYSSSLLEEFDNLKETVTNIRSIRQDKNIPQKDALELFVKRDGMPTIDLSSVICKMANLTAITHTESKVEGASSFLVKTTEFFLPLGGLLNVEEELNKLNAELTYLQGFLVSVNKKLSNSSFVNNAPAKVVEVEQNKKADAESKIKAIMGQLAQLKK